MAPGWTPPHDAMTRRVLFVGHAATRSGAPIMLLDFLRWLREASSLEFELLLGGTGPLLADYEAVCTTRLFTPRPAGTLARFTRAMPGRWWRYRRNLVRSYRARRVDLVYSNTIANGAILGVLGGLGCRILSHIHELEFAISVFGPGNLALVRQHTHRYVAAAEPVKHVLCARHGIDHRRVDVVRSFITPRARPDPRRLAGLRDELGIPGGASVVAGCGMDLWRKGRDLFARVAAHALRRSAVRPIHFVWLGRWRNEEEANQIRIDLVRLGLDSVVHLVGEVANPDDYLGMADVFLLTSREDAFPLVCLEAACHGIPTVCFDRSGGMVDLVRDGAGLVVPYGDIAAMADALMALIDDPDKASALGARAERKVREAHTTEVAGPRLLQCIERVLQP